ncbi:MAG: DUF2905 family protein [Candidatus Eremiobacteraeota bacterium]|nr:DUF2905 family protein [Candidatus Eremiobacteraeota bacterium]
MPQLGRWLVVAGVILILLGAAFIFAKPLHLGSLPGDVTFGGKGWQVSLLLGTSLLLSILFTLALNLLFRRR